MVDTLLDTLIDAFMSVGVIVAGVMLLVGGLRMVWSDRFEQALGSGRRAGPLMGALLSLPPGCVGVLTAVRLYGKGRASYGTAIAALTATMGDSAWLLLAAQPLLTVKLKLLLTGLGALLGYAIDAFGIDPAEPRSEQACRLPVGTGGGCAHDRPVAAACDRGPARRPLGAVFARVKAGLVRGADLSGTGALAAQSDDVPLVAVFWILAILGLALSIPVYFQVLDPEAMGRMFGPVDLYHVVGVAGFAASCVVFLRSRNKLCCEEVASNGRPSLREVLDATSKEVAFVTVWSGIAFSAWEWVAATWSFDPSHLRWAGAAGVLLGALSGLVPACGVEVLFASLFLSGMIPLSALVAYLISEDGSGFIPLAALRPRSAVVATVITTAPALAIGFAFLLFGY